MIGFMRLPTILLLAAAGGLTLTGLTSGGTSKGPLLSKADLPRIVAPRPPLPKGSPYIDVTTSDGDSRAFTLETSYLFEGPLLNKLKRTSFQRGYRRVWSADHTVTGDYRTAAAYALLFGDVSGARTALAAMRQDFLRGNRQARLLRAPELGVESFGLSADSRNASYAWRRGNVVLLAWVYCDVGKCRFDVAPAARAYADAIDARTKRTS